jgi:hypothetical protein
MVTVDVNYLLYIKRRIEMTKKMSEILDIYDDVQEGNPVRATSDGIAGVGDTGYVNPEAVVAGQYGEFPGGDGQEAPREDQENLDDLLPV